MNELEARRIHHELTDLFQRTAKPEAFFDGLVQFLSGLTETPPWSTAAECECRSDVQPGSAATRLLHIFAQAQLAEVQSGILHDLGGFLQNIMFSSEVVADCLADLERQVGDEARATVEQAAQAVAATRESARTGGDVLRSSAGLSRAEVGACVYVPLPWALTSSLALLRWREPEIRLLQSVPSLDVAVNLAHLRRVLINLLNNAREATQGIPAPLIEVAVTTFDDRVRIAVCDNGIGVDPEHLASLFRPFFTTKSGGAGLGLFVSRQLVEAWGGTMGVEVERRNGSVFWFTIPIDPELHSASTTTYDGSVPAI